MFIGVKKLKIQFMNSDREENINITVNILIFAH